MGYNLATITMRRICALLISALLTTGMLYADQINTTISSNNAIAICSDSNSGIVFRGTQKVRSNEGAEIYLYSNGNVQMYNSNGMLVTEAIYEWDGGSEIFIKDFEGRILYKCSCRVNQQKQLVSLTLSGETFWKKN